MPPFPLPPLNIVPSGSATLLQSEDSIVQMLLEVSSSSFISIVPLSPAFCPLPDSPPSPPVPPFTKIVVDALPEFVLGVYTIEDCSPSFPLFLVALLAFAAPPSPPLPRLICILSPTSNLTIPNQKPPAPPPEPG